VLLPCARALWRGFDSQKSFLPVAFAISRARNVASCEPIKNLHMCEPIKNLRMSCMARPLPKRARYGGRVRKPKQSWNLQKINRHDLPFRAGARL
jgi:hypothetical protein